MIQMLLNNMFSSIFTDTCEKPMKNGSAPIPEAQEKSERAPVVEDVKQDSITNDIKRLETEYGPFTEGMSITVELKRLLLLCPRSRRRKDAYKKLQKVLLRDKGVILTIKSQKG